MLICKALLCNCSADYRHAVGPASKYRDAKYLFEVALLRSALSQWGAQIINFFRCEMNAHIQGSIKKARSMAGSVVLGVAYYRRSGTRISAFKQLSCLSVDDPRSAIWIRNASHFCFVAKRSRERGEAVENETKIQTVISIICISRSGRAGYFACIPVRDISGLKVACRLFIFRTGSLVCVLRCPIWRHMARSCCWWRQVLRAFDCGWHQRSSRRSSGQTVHIVPRRHPVGLCGLLGNKLCKAFKPFSHREAVNDVLLVPELLTWLKK